jgi:hypothetical protein
MLKPSRIAIFIFLCSILSEGHADISANSFPDEDPFDKIEAINEGELELLPNPQTKGHYHHENFIEITPASLSDGWIGMRQCHHRLDAVSLLEIVYHPQRIRKIEIVSNRNIGSSRVIDSKVELRDIQPNAKLCLKAESRALHRQDDGRFILRNGPYMRRFLDGYYPMRLTVTIDYPQDILKLKSVTPDSPQRLKHEAKQGKIQWDAWFQGRLFTEFEFVMQEDP